MRPVEFFESLIDEEKTLLHFSAAWCVPCKLMEPAMAEFLSDNPNVRYIKVDVDQMEFKELTEEFGVRSVPTIVSFDGKRKIHTKRGGQNKSQLEGMWETYD